MTSTDDDAIVLSHEIPDLATSGRGRSHITDSIGA
jgi:hypothetical protein